MTTLIFSILIATRNRATYCINAIETILGFEYKNFELIIQDNSENLELQDYIRNRKVDNRLVYNYTPPPFSSIDNFNAVIGLAKGEYLCLIGDDDAVHPEIFNAVEWAKSNKIPSITPTLKAIYRWPDACDNPQDNGLLTIENISGKIKKRSTKNSIMKLMKNGGQGYLNLPFPKLYHGIVKREYMELLKEETGNYVGGLSPDIYISIGLTKHIHEIVEIDFPLTLPGICGKSAPIDEKRNKYAKLEDAPHFRDRGPYQWSPEVPSFYSGENIWADSALAALRDLKLTGFIKHFNKYQLSLNYADIYKANSSEITEFIRQGTPLLKFTISYSCNFILNRSSKLMGRIKSRLGLIFLIKNQSKELCHIEEVKSAVNHLLSLKSPKYLINYKSRV